MLSRIINAARAWLSRLRRDGAWRGRSTTRTRDSAKDPGTTDSDSPSVEPDPPTGTLQGEPPGQEDPPDPGPPEGPEPPENADEAGDEDSTPEEDETDEGPQGASAPKAPTEHGGRRKRSEPPPSGTNQPDSESPPQPRPGARPELICRKALESSHWSLILSVPSDSDITSVMQSGVPLDVVGGACKIPSIEGSLTIGHESGDNTDMALFDGSPLIFKFRKNWVGDGRKVRAITKGHFIVIAPRDWQRNGRVAVEPKGCGDPGFTAHYFSRKGDSPEEDMGGFEEWAPELTKSKFRLEGNVVFDCHDCGDLFGGDAPQLRCGSEVAWARVGNEGDGEWRGENFNPSKRELPDVLDGRQGSFFVRVYDEKATLLDSGEFRFAKHLKQILINGEPYSQTSLLLPRTRGHPRAKVRFVPANSNIVQSELDDASGESTLKADGTIEINRDPNSDDLRCALVDGEYRVEVAVLIPRVWWCWEGGSETSEQWRDTPFALSRSKFRRRTDEGEGLRIRLPQCVKVVRAGFGEDLDHRYSKNDSGWLIPLLEFVDCQQIDEVLLEDALFNLQLDRSGAESVSLPVMRLTADPVPEIVTFEAVTTVVDGEATATLRWTTRNAAGASVRIEPDIGEVEPNGSVDVRLQGAETFTLSLTKPGFPDSTRSVTCKIEPRARSGLQPRPQVMRTGGGWRCGKGFSLGEVCAVGFTRSTAAWAAMPVDKRRRSIHSINVESLRRWNDARP